MTEHTTEVQVQGEVAPGFEPVQQVFQRHLANEIGAAVALYRNGRMLVDLWGGHRDRQRQLPWQRDTLACTFSCSKAMTALCLAQAVADGAVRLDAPVSYYWPEFAAAGKSDLPVHLLLSHQAGLPGIREPLPADALYHWEIMTDALAAEAPWWPPGSSHGYHARSFGYLVGEVLRRATDMTVGEWLQERVTGPLAADFHIGLPAAEHQRVADMVPAKMVPAKMVPERMAAGGGRKVASAQAALMKDLRNPATATGAAFANPAMRAGYMNSAEFRQAEIPAANGHGTARALADIYSVLVSRPKDKPELLPLAVQQQFTTERAYGPDQVLKGNMRFGLGFMLTQPDLPLGPGQHSFGHAGAGGSLAFADPDQGLGFAWVMNQMQQGLVTGSGAAVSLVHAVYRCLERAR